MPPVRSEPAPFTPADIAYQMAHADDTQVPRIVSISVLLIVLTVVAVMLRFVARSMRKLPWGLDDYFMVPSLFFTVMLCVENLICVRFGNGRHVITLPRWQAVEAIRTIYFLSVTYAFVHFFIKMSILFLFRRLFGDINRAFTVGLRVTMAYVTAWSVAAASVCIFQCTPIAYFWKRAMINAPPGHCINVFMAEVILNVLNTVGDIATLMLPILALWHVQMTIQKKVGVIAICLVGIFAVGAGIARIFMILEQTMDVTWDNSNLVIWTAIEPAVGILCACFPVIAPALSRKLIKKRFGRGGERGGPVGPGGSSHSFLRKLFRSKNPKKSGEAAPDDNLPLSRVSSDHSHPKESVRNDKGKHGFSQISNASINYNAFVVQSNVKSNVKPSRPVTGQHQTPVPAYKDANKEFDDDGTHRFG